MGRCRGRGWSAAMALANVPSIIAAQAPLPQKTGGRGDGPFLWERPVGRDGVGECAEDYRGAGAALTLPRFHVHQSHAAIISRSTSTGV